MANKIVQNQPHPPRKKYPGEVDEGANKKKRIFVKTFDGRSSILLGRGTTNAGKVFISSLRENAKKLGIELESNLIITQ